MTTYQRIKQTMYKSVLALFKARKTITDQIPALAGAIELLQQTVNRIDVKANEKENAGAGAIDTRDAAEETLVRLVFEVASALYAYASEMNLADVKDIAGIKRSKLEHLPKLELEQKAQAIADLGAKYADKIVNYGASAEKLSALNSAITDYKGRTDAVATGLVGRSGAVTTLKSLFIEADIVLKERIDNMVNNLQNTEKQFYAEYKAARVIHDIGGGHVQADTAAQQTQATPPAK